MTALKGKWKVLLVLNYFSAATWVMLLLVYLVILWQSKRDIAELRSNVVAILAGGMSVIFFNIFFIYVLKEFFPAVRVKGLVKFLYFTGLVFVGILAILFIALVLVSSLDVFEKGNADVYSLVTLVFSSIFAVIDSLLVVWHFQLLDILIRNNAKSIESVLNSIGVDENNYVE
ncbi:MAG: hypothetical protein GXC73_02930 [Chitinophagaceae bacterium]|nr:hypothetical protein [Chitinophagaceae bacterium]